MITGYDVKIDLRIVHFKKSKMQKSKCFALKDNLTSVH